MLRGRIVAVNGVQAEELKPPPNAAWVLQSDRGITYTERGAGRLARGRGPMVGAGLQRPAARLVREEDRRRPRPQGRRRDRGQRARPQHHGAHRQPAHASTGRASASISCWCFRPARSAARRIPSIATLTYPGGAHDRGGDRAAQGGGARPSRRSPPCACKEALEAVGGIVSKLVVGDPRRQPDHHRWPRFWCWRRARGRPSPSRLRCGGAQDARRDARAADCGLCARIPAARAGDRVCSAWRPARSPPGSSSPR